MIKDSDIHFCQYSLSEKAITLTIACEDVEHAETVRKEIMHCQRVERDLDGYIRILDDAGHDIADKSPKTLSKELSDLVENKLFEDAHIEDECND